MSLLEADLKYIWHPAQQMKDAEVFPPVVIDHGKGCYLYDTEGKEYIDIISSWWCNLLGHCNDETPSKTSSASWNTSSLPISPIVRLSSSVRRCCRCCQKG